LSGIALELRTDRPAARETIDAMLGRMRHRAIDGSGTWLGGSIALGLAAAWYTPEDVGLAAPLVGAHGWVVAFDGRLDDRPGLARALAVEDAGPDAKLVLAAIDRWDADAPKHLIGDFAFAAWNVETQRGVLARDAVGECPLFYASHGRGLRAASEQQALFVDELLPKKPDLDQIAFILAEEYAENDATLLEGISAVPPGHVDTFDARGVRVERYWDPARFSGGPRTHEDAVDALDAALGLAVQARLRARGGIAIAASGGIDSSTIASIATERLRASGSDPLLFTARFPDLACDESVFSERLARHLGLSLETVVATDLDDPARYAPPPHPDLQLDAFHNLYSRMGNMARDRGAAVMLSGWGSDELQWCTGLEIHDALACHNRQELARRAGLYEEPLSRRAWRTLAGAALRGFAPRGWERLQSWRSGPRPLPNWLTVDARRRVEGLRVARAARLAPLERLGASQSRIISALTESLQSPFGMGQRQLSAAVAGYELRDPFFDRRVVELLLSTSPLVRTDPSVGKPLTRSVAGRRLPASLAFRTHPATEFTTFFNRTARAFWASLTRDRWSSVLVTLGLLEPTAAQQLEAAARGDCDVRALLTVGATEAWARAWFGPPTPPE
jgi:asparagine synthetase B (glutamine-hydrolysing)